MTVEEYAIIDRDTKEKLVPVLTYVHSFSPRESAAWLSFLCVCHDDLSQGLRLPDVLSPNDEIRCIGLLDEVIEKYFLVERLPLTAQIASAGIAYAIIHGLSAETAAFFKDRMRRICGAGAWDQYWELFYQAPSLDAISERIRNSSSVLQTKKMVDFSLFFIALAMLYCSGDDYHRRMAGLDENLRAKFGNAAAGRRIGLCLWPLNFSFLQDGEDGRENHPALLRAVRSVNPDARVQVCTDSLVWSRDIIAWVDDACTVFVEPAKKNIPNKFGAGFLNEGGNIIPGTCRDKFVLVAQGAFPDAMTKVDFCYEMFKRDVLVYTLPDGFLWSRNPVDHTDIILDSIHIDTVINVIPACCTHNGRPKIIIDPVYYTMAQDSDGFRQFLREQAIPPADIIVVDEQELYLNLPNFSALLDRQGRTKLLFNKDLGYTLPRLGLRPDTAVRPDTEISGLSIFFGSLRCATNMLPESFVKACAKPAVSVSRDFPPAAGDLLTAVLHGKEEGLSALSASWVLNLEIRPCHRQQPWEFDEFSRTAYLYLFPGQTRDPEACGRFIDTIVSDMGKTLGRRLGIGGTASNRTQGE